MNEFHLLIENRKPNIISVTETWGNDGIVDGLLSLKGYNMYRDDRNTRKGGGTILYVSDKIEQRVCRPLNTNDFENSAWCWIVIKGGKKVLVGSVYRSDNGSAENNALLVRKMELANEVAGENRLLILGDFNLPKVDWVERRLLPGAKIIETTMLTTVTDCLLHQHVNVPTRFRNDQSSTLDLIFTKEEGDIKNIEVLPPLGSSDHGVVIADFVCEWKSRVVHRPRRMYHRGNYPSIVHGLNEVDWEDSFRDKSVQECWDMYKAKLEELVEENVPMSKSRDYNEPWMNGRLMRYWRRKHFAWKRFTERKCYARYQEYKRERNLLKKQTRQAKRLYEKNLAKEVRHNKRAFFRYVNSKLTVRPELTEIQNANGELIDNDKEICDIMGEYFSSVRAPRCNDDMPFMENMFSSEIGEVETNRENIQGRLQNLKIYRSSGSDNIHPQVLRETAGASSIPLEIIFRKSITLGECPSDWRSANVTPIHKKGDRTVPSNYRPVSLTSQVCKVLESIVKDKIVDHLKKNNTLSDNQHGFREGRSCLTNLLETLEMWTGFLDDGDGVDVAYLDFRKAFDLVSHRHLLYKMSKFGITGQVLKWVESFLDQRSERVVIRGTSSEPFAVTSGVPQGSVLGPVLFLIFINDLPLEVISPLSLFADDSKVFSRIVSDKNKRRHGNQTDNNTLQRDLDTIREWARKWKMEFNVDKCKIMHIGKSNPRRNYTMNGTQLTTVTEEKDLGVLIDEKLLFDKHIREIVNKANRMLGLIRIGFTCLDADVFMNLYLVMVRPLLEYCVQAWSPHRRRDISLIEGVQRRATKLVPGLKDLSYEQRLVRLNLTTLEERRTRGDMIQAYKMITRKEDINPDKFFKMRSQKGNPNVGHRRRIFKKRINSKLNVRKYFFSQRVVGGITPRGIALGWNMLPARAVRAGTTSTFKKNLDKFVNGRRASRGVSAFWR